MSTDKLGQIKLDLIAERLNAQVKYYVSWKPGPIAVATDAFMIKWTYRQAYAFPPFCLIPKCTDKYSKKRKSNNCNSMKEESNILPSST